MRPRWSRIAASAGAFYENPPHLYLICVWREKMCRSERKIFFFFRNDGRTKTLAGLGLRLVAVVLLPPARCSRDQAKFAQKPLHPLPISIRIQSRGAAALWILRGVQLELN